MTISVHLWRLAAMASEPVLRLMLKVRLRRGKELPERLHERRGIERRARPEGRILWLHAASVGEIVSLIPVLRRLHERAPNLTLLVTTGTVTSARLLDQRVRELGLDPGIIHRFVPLDVPRWVDRFLDHWRPSAAVFVESELWPNILAGLGRHHIPAMLLNARMSARSYGGWRRAPAFIRHLLSCFSAIHARSEQDAERFRTLGAIRVVVSGDLKFAADPLGADLDELGRLQRTLGNRPAWLAASTHPGEEELAARVHARLSARFPHLLTVIIPRHPQRGPAIQAELGAASITRRAAGEDPPERGGIWIADTLGELGLLYRLIPVVFVGRSLLPPGGGQNPLEPARLGCAVAVGPYTANFSEAVGVLSESGALTQVADTPALTAWVGTMLSDMELRNRAGEAAQRVSRRYTDLPDRIADDLLELIKK